MTRAAASHYPHRRALLLACAALPVTPWARAQGFPSRPLRQVVPFPAGGPTDALARIVGAAMAAHLGQPVVIENKSGAVGQIGQEDVRRSPPDGYTLVSLVIPAVLNHHFLGKPLSAQRDFTTIGLVATQFNVLVVNPAANGMDGIGTLAQMLALAKAKPGQIAFTTAGQGSLGHLTVSRLARLAGATLMHVPYRGAQPRHNRRARRPGAGDAGRLGHRLAPPALQQAACAGGHERTTGEGTARGAHPGRTGVCRHGRHAVERAGRDTRPEPRGSGPSDRSTASRAGRARGAGEDPGTRHGAALPGAERVRRHGRP